MSKKDKRPKNAAGEQTEDLQAYAAFANHLYPDQIDLKEAEDAYRDTQPKSEKEE